jgi:hypothetical protein
MSPRVIHNHTPVPNFGDALNNATHVVAGANLDAHRAQADQAAANHQRNLDANTLEVEQHDQFADLRDNARQFVPHATHARLPLTEHDVPYKQRPGTFGRVALGRGISTKTEKVPMWELGSYYFDMNTQQDQWRGREMQDYTKRDARHYNGIKFFVGEDGTMYWKTGSKSPIAELTSTDVYCPAKGQDLARPLTERMAFVLMAGDLRRDS